MANNIDYDRAAIILVEATFFEDKTVAKNWGVSPKTIYNYRQRLQSDLELADNYRLKKKSLSQIGAMA